MKNIIKTVFIGGLFFTISQLPSYAQQVTGSGSGIPRPVVNGSCIIGSGGQPVWGSCSGAGTAVTSVTGTVGQVTVSPTTGDVTVSLPATITANETFSGAITLSGSISGAALTNYLASPAAIGGTAPASGKFTTLTATGNLTTNVVGSTQCLQASSTGLVSGTGVACPTGGGGTVTSVGLSAPSASIFGITGSPVTVSGTLGFTTSGTSGGIPYFSSATQLNSTVALTAHGVVLGEGAGSAPVATSAGIAGQVLTSNGASSDPTFQTVSGTGTVTTITLASGLAKTVGTRNIGTDSITSTGTINPQLFLVNKAGNYTVNADNGGTSDTGALLTCTGTCTFTEPNPAVGTQGNMYQSASDGTHGHTLATVGGTATFYGSTHCTGATTATLPINFDVQILDDGTNYKCTEATGSGAGGGGGGTVTSVSPGAGTATSNIGGTTPITTSGTVYADASYFTAYMGGLTLSNDTNTPNTIIDIAAGSAVSDDSTVMMKLAAFTKTTGGWSLGTAGGCLDTGAVGNNTWYHIFLIERTDTGVVDVLCSTSASAPSFPTNYTKKRRIGSIKTNGAAAIVSFIQNGSTFLLGQDILDINTSTLGTTAALQTLASVPLGVKVVPICRYTVGNTGASVLITSPDEKDELPTTTTPISAVPGFDQLDITLTAGDQNSTCPFLSTNTSQQVRARASAASTTLSIVTRGWSETGLGSGAAAPGSSSGGGSSVAPSPQGRLTCTSNTPVMTADVAACTTIYLDTYQGNLYPVWNGSSMVNVTITADQISMGLDAGVPHIASGNLYDIFGTATAALCAGPAWTSGTARGTGAGTTELELKSGIWANKNALTNCWGGASGTTNLGSIAADQATWLGTLRATGNGQTTMQFTPAAAAGGSNAFLGLCNGYNTSPGATSRSLDSTASWTNGSSTWVSADGSNSNRISYVDCIGQVHATATYSVLTTASGGTCDGLTGVNRDSTSATPLITGDANLANGSGVYIPSMSVTNFPPSIGFHFLQAMESNSTNAAGCVFIGGRSMFVASFTGL